MSGRHRCPWCGERIGPTGALKVKIERPGREAVVLRWHMPDCAEADPLHMQLADAIGLPDNAEGDDATRVAYVALVSRAREQGSDALREIIDIPRDIPNAAQTLRGPGLAWGVLSRQQRARACVVPQRRGRR